MAENIDDIVFNIVNQEAIDRLIADGEIILPKKKVAVSKDEKWNNKQMTSKVLRGIQNGDSIPKIAKSMMDTVGNNKFSAIRNARTMVTSAENHGRLDSFKNLSDQGVVMKKEWEATPDDRTRPSHVDIDGEEQDIDKVFSNGCMFPGDGKGPAEEVWMCRCAMGSHIIGFKRSDGSVSKIEYGRDRTTHDDQMETFKNKSTKVVAGNIDRNYNSDFAKNYGNDFYNAMCDLIDGCENDDLKAVWEQYQDKIVANDPNYKGRAYASINSIHVNKAADIKGSSYDAPYSVTFHESGHAIDHITKDLAETNGLKLTYSSAYKDGLYPATIREEVAALVKAKDTELKALFKEHANDYEWLHNNGFISDYSWRSYQMHGQFFGGAPKYAKSFAYSAIQKEIKSLPGGGLAIGDLSDMLEGATDGKIACGYGHGKSYWKKLFGVDEKLATEAFAEMTSATVTNPESLKVIKQYLPKSYGVYKDMIKDLAKKGVK